MGQQRGKKVMGEGRGKVCQELDLKKKEPNADTVGEEIKQNSLPYVTKIKR